MDDQATPAVEDPSAALLSALDNAPPEEDQVEGEAPEAEEPEAEEPEEEEKPAVDQKFRVKVKNDSGEDEDRDLSLEELAAGYMQSADYTRKTQALATEQKKAQEQYFSAIQQTAQQARQELAALQQLVIATTAPELQQVNWQQLAMEDPARYVQLQARQQQLNQVLGYIQQEDGKLKQQQERTQIEQREQAKKHSLEYLSREIPGFNLQKDATKLFEAGKKYSFSEEEIGNVIDGRMLHVLHDAAKWRELQAAKPKALQKVTEAPKVVKPAAPQPKRTNQSALDRLKKTGRPSELVNFL